MQTDAITEQLKIAIEHATKLSPDAQDLLAQQMDAAITLIERAMEIANAHYWEEDNRAWDEQLRTPESLAVLRRMAQEAQAKPKLPFPMPERGENQ